MPHGADGPLQGRRILVVEDEVLVAMELESLLTDEGCDVVGPVPSAERALALIERELPDIAILDANLNGTSAAPVAEALRERGVPFLVATGYAEEQSLKPELRGAPRVDKPVNHASLVRALAGVLEDRR